MATTVSARSPAPSGTNTRDTPDWAVVRRWATVSSARRRGHPRTASLADVAQLVERNLAKVEVASSSLVVRSEKGRSSSDTDPSLVEWPRGEATDCKSVYTGSNPVSTSQVPGRLAQW